jgi:hypothetical protein
MRRRCCLGVLFVLPVAGPALVPGAPAPAPAARARPTLALQAAHPPDKLRRAQLFVFEGSSAVSVHRPGPEHFKLTRVADGKEVALSVAYDRDDLEVPGGFGGPVKARAPRVRVRYRYNTLFKGVRLFLDTGPSDVKGVPGKAGVLDLYGRALLEPGARYRLTWACWPVGAWSAAEVSCEFALAK